MIELIVATDQRGVISQNGNIPWKCPEDMRYFKTKTLHKNVVMGRKTCETLKKPLIHRNNFVLTNNVSFKRHDFNNITFDQIMESDNDFVVIGGRQIYDLFLKSEKVDLIYINVIRVLTNQTQNELFFDFDKSLFSLIDCYTDVDGKFDSYIYKKREHHVKG